MASSQEIEYTIPCKGIVAYDQHTWILEKLLTRAPHSDEFLVEMIATGVCHTDISGYGGIYPRVLGHEGAGRIIQLGSKDQEANWKVGDLVILSAAACLECLYCTTGHPAYCVEHAKLTLQANEPVFVLESDKTKVIGGGYFGQSSFASPAPVKISAAANVTKLIKDADELKLYAPLGCGIMTGAGAITHVGKCGPDDVVAVVGLGGVGLAGICAAVERKVGTIIAVDLNPARVELAAELGATKGLLSSKEVLGDKTLAEAIKEMSPQGLGATAILDTTPSVAILSECLGAIRKNGMVLQVGVKPVDAKLEVDCLQHMVNGRRLVGVIEGDRDPAEALPELVQWSKDGVLPVGKMFKEFPLEDFENAKRKMEEGSVIKGVLIW
ncbi:Putative GroES-like superfamily, alcohol dehydrogenase-like, NAD(P)-binding domain superfamily [Septoria linicola]|uniref:GroES-like superfamily, alcohol dehydrogenase-like, NAD(P)-binding domain superfamily n=1 Tax=Septoria linicola TaxID=215465 RepID=A0A9Q9EPC4_9PEZI|nr:putative GroES-like superfamily, alcohol dehydrogenase-like, NAD(P)-binding domain superfamily [Septoria linicola]USW57524.1 Putative GroES-like superfamily, alcohol dehydrogenase-like, NAD(P)-binding domain superfamily [Septoria linicola]